MKKRRRFFLLSALLWGMGVSAIFFLFPTHPPLNGFSRFLLITLLNVLSIPSLLAMFFCGIAEGWGILSASLLVSAFFALRFASPSLLSPLPLLLWTGSASHFAVLSLRNRMTRMELAMERLEMEEHLLATEEQEEEKRLPALKRKLERYASLSHLTNLLSSSLVFKEVTQFSVQKAHEVIGKSGGSLLLLVDETGELSLESSYFEKDFPGTKLKKGDLFDQWVLKHRRPLLVRDIQKDFRFDKDRLEKRDLGSLIATPLMTGERITGVLRLESSQMEGYTSDDLRLLSIVGDLVASSVENARLAQRTEELARIDELTGLYVHRYFQERLQEEFSRSQRTRSRFSLLMADIDHFKTYNDRYGHIAGDLVLKQVARILKEGGMAGDTLCRYGGEEFCLILPQRTKAEALVLAEELRQSVEAQAFVLRRETTHVTLSFGVATFPEDGLVKDELLKQVDDYLYRAKREGRNRVCGV